MALNRKQIMGLGFFLVSLIIAGLIGYTIAQTTNTFYISNGIYPSAYDYTIYYENSVYYAKNKYGFNDFYGTNLTLVIVNAENIVDDNGGTIYLKGLRLPITIVLSTNVLVIEEYEGIITYYNELNNLGYLENWFTDKGFYSINAPSGYYYNGRTYIAYQQGYTQDAMITYYDNQKQIWANPIKVGINPLTSDSHGSPSLIVDNNGYIHVFFGTHSFTPSYMQHYRSTYSENISAWTDIGTLGNNPTFPFPVKRSNGYIYLFYGSSIGASEVNFCYLLSIDNGLTFGSEQNIIDFGSGYAIQYASLDYDSSNDRIGIAFHIRTYPADERYNCSYAYFNPQNLHLYAVDDTDLGTQITLGEYTTITFYDSGASQTISPTLHFNPSYEPYIISGNTTNNYWQFWRYDTGTTTWIEGDIYVTSFMAIYFQADFIINNASYIDAYITVGRLDTTSLDRHSFSVMQFESLDSGASWYPVEIIMDLPDMWYVPRINAIVNYQDELKIMFVPEYMFYQIKSIEEFLMNYKMYAYGDYGFVKRRYYFGV